MKILRTLLVLLLCAVLPLSGLAASGLTGQCPMQMPMSAEGGSAMSDNMTDCGMIKSSSAGKSRGVSCKVTAQCQLGSLYHPVSTPVVLRPAGSFNPVTFHYAESLSIREPDGPWRPPRSL